MHSTSHSRKIRSRPATKPCTQYRARPYWRCAHSAWPVWYRRPGRFPLSEACRPSPANGNSAKRSGPADHSIWCCLCLIGALAEGRGGPSAATATSEPGRSGGLIDTLRGAGATRRKSRHPGHTGPGAVLSDSAVRLSGGVLRCQRRVHDLCLHCADIRDAFHGSAQTVTLAMTLLGVAGGLGKLFVVRAARCYSADTMQGIAFGSALAACCTAGRAIGPTCWAHWAYSCWPAVASCCRRGFRHGPVAGA